MRLLWMAALAVLALATGFMAVLADPALGHGETVTIRVEGMT